MGIMWGVCASAALWVTTLAEPTVVSTDNPEMTASEAAETTTVNFIPAGTLIEIRIDEQVSSKTHKTGDWYSLSLAHPVLLDGRELLPAGTPGRGQVVHAAKSGWGGKAGELILAARYLETPYGRLALRGMKLGSTGRNNSTEAMAAGLVLTPLPFVISGTSAAVEKSYIATAKLVADLYPQESAKTGQTVSGTEPKTEGQ